MAQQTQQSARAQLETAEAHYANAEANLKLVADNPAHNLEARFAAARDRSDCRQVVRRLCHELKIPPRA